MSLILLFILLETVSVKIFSVPNETHFSGFGFFVLTQMVQQKDNQSRSRGAAHERGKNNLKKKVFQHSISLCILLRFDRKTTPISFTTISFALHKANEITRPLYFMLQCTCAVIVPNLKLVFAKLRHVHLRFKNLL